MKTTPDESLPDPDSISWEDLEISGSEVLNQILVETGGDHRPGQAAMAKEVDLLLKTGSAGMIQAGTGTGKSFAYLAPALAYSGQTGNRVVISTATLALQKQLMSKDLPVARKAWLKLSDQPLKTAVLKGWQNYVCLARLQAPEEVETLFDLDLADSSDLGKTAPTSLRGKEIARLRKWVKTTRTGDRDDLIPAVSEAAWRQASINPSDCPKDECPLAGECFASKARQRALAADLVITNHSLLGLAAMTEANVLPEFSALIIDEAHELPDRVRSQATLRFTTNQVRRICTAATRKLSLQTEAAIRVLESIDNFLSHQESAVWEAIPTALAENLTALSLELDQLLTEVGQPENQDPKKAVKRQLRMRLAEQSEIVNRILAYDPLWSALWLEVDRNQQAQILTAPLAVGKNLAERLYQNRAAVFTSATLQLGGSFKDIAREIGVDLRGLGAATTGGEETGSAAEVTGNTANAPSYFGKNAWELSVESPFNYSQQGILYVPEDLPTPGRSGLDPQYLARIEQLVAASEGGMLGLFSSRRAAETAAEYLRNQLDLPIYCQGEDNLGQLIADFAADPNACLLGSLSLWQGVDVPGLSSRLVVIDRIPFPRPNDPFVSARDRAAKARGQNAFHRVYLTQAALLLAQGVGRLIRSKTDRGVVAILDPRLRTARYGNFLQASLPDFARIGEGTAVCAALQRLSS